MPTVSVLIPVYNGEAFVENAIRSALDQRDVDVEVIVIDDGSVDRTPAVLAQFGDRIRVLRQQNAGHVVSRNNGSRLARGDWLAFLDADDEWLPDKLEHQVAALMATPGAGVATSGIFVCYEDRQTPRVCQSDRITLPDLLRSRVR